MLVHICCSVDSHYFLTRLRADYPHEKLVGYFYNPNIHPKSEYDLRLLDVRRSCAFLGIELFEDEYDDMAWMVSVRGLESEPEKGKRCEVCFDYRFEKSAEKAMELGLKSFTSTLLQSPLKDKNQLHVSLEKISQKHGVEFVFVDYLSGGGKEAQAQVANSSGLYRQNYCGCTWGVLNQREAQKKPALESFSSVTGEILPCSAPKRLGVYSKRQLGQKTVKSKTLNYRLLFAKLSVNDEAVPSYCLTYSVPSKKSFSSAVDFVENGVAYLKKDGAKIISISVLQGMLGEIEMKDILSNGLPLATQIQLRSEISKSFYDVSPIFIAELVDLDANYKIEIEHIMQEELDEN